MFTRVMRVGGAAVAALVVLGIVVGEVGGQGFRPGNQVAGGVGMGRPSGTGFGGGLPMGAYGSISSSPLSTVGANPYSGGLPGIMDPYGAGYWNNMGDPYGGYLKGAASVISAQGQQAVSFQQAYQIKEETRRMQIENRRRLFDEWLYERSNTPSLQDELERVAKLELRRSRFDPPKPEIWSGRALNVLLESLIRTDRAKAQGGSTTVEESVLKRINLTSGKGGINLGVLKNDGKLEWPVALRTAAMGQEGKELRNQIQALTKKAYDDVKAGGKADPNTVKDIKDSSARLQQMLTKNINEVDFNQYVDAKRYINGLNDGVNLLVQNDAGDYLNGKYSLANLKGNTVNDVVNYMKDNGLLFAPAVEGEQAAYLALHRALANYDVAASALIAEK